MERKIHTVAALLAIFVVSSSWSNPSYQEGDAVAFLPKTAEMAILRSDKTWILPTAEEYSEYLSTVPEGVDILGSIASPPLFSDTSVTSKNWGITTGADELSDIKWYLFTAPAIDGDYDSYSRPTLRVYFDEEKDTFVSIYWNDFIGTGKSVSVTWRIDEEKATRHEWSGSGDGKITFVPRMHYDFAKSFIGKKRFVARVVHYDGTTTTATFDISGFPDFIAQVKPSLAECWPDFMP